MIFRLLKRILRCSYDFRLPPGLRPLPACHIRLARDDDFSACEEIYRLNEPERFPSGYFEHFSRRLRERRTCWLVAEEQGEVRGFGGICQFANSQQRWVSLEFGMVHPKHHRRGFGTALLLARMAALPEPLFWHQMTLTPAGGSETFYQRFGFIRSGDWVDDRGAKFDHYYMRFDSWDWALCRKTLTQSSIHLDLGDVPVPIIMEEPKSPDG